VLHIHVDEVLPCQVATQRQAQGIGATGWNSMWKVLSKGSKGTTQLALFQEGALRAIATPPSLLFQQRRQKLVCGASFNHSQGVNDIA
jgi:hypothetical protein